MVKLRDGTTTHDPRLGRLQQFDPRSRNYAATDHPKAAKGPRSYTWRLRPGNATGPTARGEGRWLDQQGEGSCVGHGIAHELAAPPQQRKVDGDLAVYIYRQAQKVDPWEGEQYEGTSVLAGMQVAQREGLIGTYRWAFGEDDLWQVVGRLGPAVIGIPWYESMYQPNQHGYLVPEGRVVGKHCLLVTGQSIRRGDYELLNSWNTFGLCRVARGHMARLLGEGGEACIPEARS